MNLDDAQICTQAQDNVRAYGRYCAQHEFTTALIDVIYKLLIEREELIGTTNQQSKDITSLTHLLSIYSNANSTSRQDPKGYEATKQFLAIAKAYEAAKEGEQKDDDVEIPKEGGDSTEVVQAKPCVGRPGHPGISHHAKSEYTTVYTAEMCGSCGSTDLELLNPINRLSTERGKEGESGEDTKRVHTDRVIFGWCNTCPNLVDPAPHIVWGTWMTGKVLATTIQYKSNPLGRSKIVENLGAIHSYAISPAAVSNSVTAHSRSLEEKVYPPSVVSFVKAKIDGAIPQGDAIPGSVEPAAPVEPAEPAAPDSAEEILSRLCYTVPAEPPEPSKLVERVAEPPSPAHPTVLAPTAPERMTKKERKAAMRNVPHAQTPQGMTDKRLTCHTTSYPGSYNMSFIELCREYLTMEPWMGVDQLTQK